MLKLVVENLFVAYDDELVIENLNFEFNGYGIIQVIGPNGAGKTTLLKAIAGLLKPVKGRVLIEDDSRVDKVLIGYVPQDALNIATHYPVTVYDYVASSYSIGKRWPRVKLSRTEEELVKNAIFKVGLSSRDLSKPISELSGGERQRVFIARCLVLNPSVILLDEPFSSVDREGRFQLAELISALSDEKLFIVANHDPYLLIERTKSILMMNKRVYFYGRPDEVLVKDKVAMIYGERALKRDNIHVLILDSCYRA